MDQNLELLKSNIHSQTQTFLQNTLNANLLSTITRPTGITESSATLNENIYISNQLNYKFNSYIDKITRNDKALFLSLTKEQEIKKLLAKYLIK